MFDRAQLQTALYEISMHIGTSTNPNILVKDAISAFMRQLDCSGALVCREGVDTNKRFYMLPKNLLFQDNTKTFLNTFCQEETSSSLYHDKDKPYTIHQDKNIYYHIFTLKGFGLLILVKNNRALSETFAKALEPVCNKFATALNTTIKAQAHTENLINFKTLIDTISEGLALFDENLTCIEINKSALDKFQYSHEEALGKHIFTVIHQEDHEKLHQLNQQEHAQSEWKLLKQDGSTFPAFVSGSNILYRGKPSRIITFLDLTDIKEKEKQLYNQSRPAQMGEMISMIAHQWRQPLGAISASVIGIKTKIQMKKFDLTEETGRVEQEQYLMQKLDKMGDYIEHLSETIEDFRNFFKPDKEKSVVNLEEIINKALDIMHPGFIDNHIIIQKYIHFEKEIETYQNEVLQALLNLLKNSIDHFETVRVTSPTIIIRGYEEDRTFILEVTDNGGGIPEKILSKIFDPYFSTKDDKNGTGLGLYMTKTMIEDHCLGKITAKNHNGGARFTIRLR